MAKQSEKPDIPADMWLHVVTDALAKYAAMDDSEGVAVGFSEGMTKSTSRVYSKTTRGSPPHLWR